VLNALILKSSDLLQFNHTHNAAVFSSKWEAFDLQIGYITPSFVGHSFRVTGETWYFLPIHPCAFGFNLKYIFASFYASRTLGMKLLIWFILISLAVFFGSALA